MDYSILTLFLVIAASFLSTNLDNLVLLTLLQNSQQQGKFMVSLGYAIAAAIVVGLAVGVALAGGGLDGRYVGFLGAIPVFIGGRVLWRQYSDSGTTGVDPTSRTFGARWSLVAGSAALMLGNSGDSLAVLLPLFLDTRAQYYWFLVLCYALFVAFWIVISLGLSANIARARRFVALGEKVAPWIMIALGVYIFMDTAADTVL